MANMTRWNGTSGYPILKLNEAKPLVATAQGAAFGIELTGGDYKTLIYMVNANSAAKYVRISYADSSEYLQINLAATGDSDGKDKQAIVLDSRYFKNMSGTNKDMVIVTPEASTNMSFAVIELPQ